MSTDEIAFIEEIRQAPDDITPRLIYADFLEDDGNPRGEFIRVQCELSQTSAGDSSRPALFDRERELLQEFGERWLAPVRALGVENVSHASFRCGLLERVRISADKFLQHNVELFRLLPALTCLDLRQPQAVGRQLADCDMPPQVTALDLSANHLEPSHLQTLNSAGWAAGIQSLSLQMNQLNDDVFAVLGDGNWQALRQLKVGMNRMGPAGIRSLSELPSLPILEELDLRMNPISNQGLGRLAGTAMPELQTLNLVRCEIQTIRALIDRDRWPRLMNFCLRNNRISTAELDEFHRSPVGQRLTEFDIRNN